MAFEEKGAYEVFKSRKSEEKGAYETYNEGNKALKTFLAPK